VRREKQFQLSTEPKKVKLPSACTFQTLLAPILEALFNFFYGVGKIPSNFAITAAAATIRDSFSSLAFKWNTAFSKPLNRQTMSVVTFIKTAANERSKFKQLGSADNCFFFAHAAPCAALRSRTTPPTR